MTFKVVKKCFDKDNEKTLPVGTILGTNDISTFERSRLLADGSIEVVEDKPKRKRTSTRRKKQNVSN